MTLDTQFSRLLLARTHADVKQAIPGTRPMRDAWVHDNGHGCWEFNGPSGFYWHGRASSAYEARHKGWSAYLNNVKGIH